MGGGGIIALLSKTTDFSAPQLSVPQLCMQCMPCMMDAQGQQGAWNLCQGCCSHSVVIVSGWWYQDGLLMPPECLQVGRAVPVQSASGNPKQMPVQYYMILPGTTFYNYNM